MPFQAVANCASVVLSHHLFDGRVTQNVFHLELTVPLTQALTDTWAGEFASDLADISAYQFNADNYTGIVATDLRTLGAPQFSSTNGFPVAGGSGSDPLPDQNALLISWKTGFRGPEGRGRTYIDGLVEAAITSGFADPGLVTAASEMADDITSNGNFVAVVASRVLNKIPRAVGVTHVITGHVVQTRIATQRRRR